MSPTEPGAPSRSAAVLRLVLPGIPVLLGILLLASAPWESLTSNDFFFHLAAGRHVLATGASPAVDPFSPNAAPQAKHEVVWGVLCALAVEALGAAGPKLLVAALVAALLVVLWRALGPAPGLVEVGLWGTALWCGKFAWEQERPYHLAHLLFALLLLALRGREGRAAWWAVPLLWVWANLHGSWPVGAALLGLRTAGRFLDEGVLDRRLGLVAVLATLAAAVHPMGPANLLYPLVHQTLPSTQFINEWMPLDFSIGFSWGLVGLLVALATMWKAKGFWTVALPALVLTVGAFHSRRHGPFAGMALAVACAQLLAGSSPPVLQALDARWRAWSRLAGGELWLVAALCLSTGQALRAPRALLDGVDAERYPMASLRRLRQLPPGRVLTKFEWGSLVSALAGSAYPVYLDSRNDPYPLEIHEAYHGMRALKPGWRESLAAFGPRYVLWGGIGNDFSFPLIWALQADGWTVLERDEVGWLLVPPDFGTASP